MSSSQENDYLLLVALFSAINFNPIKGRLSPQNFQPSADSPRDIRPNTSVCLDSYQIFDYNEYAIHVVG